MQAYPAARPPSSEERAALLEQQRQHQQQNLREFCFPIEEACVIVDTLIACTPGLCLQDFFRSRVLNRHTEPHAFRRALFERAGLSPAVLRAFEELCNGWVENKRVCVLQLRAAVRELLDKGHVTLSALSPMAACCAVEAALCRLYFVSLSTTNLVLYRGLRRVPKECYGAPDGGGGGMRKRELVVVRRHACEAHSSSILVARAYGRRVVKEIVPTTHILMCYKTNSVMEHDEREYVVMYRAENATVSVLREPASTRKEKIFRLLLCTKMYSPTV